MDLIRPFSIEGPQQRKFVQAYLEMIEEFLKNLPRIEASELANDSRCIICHHEYSLANSDDATTIEEAEEAVRLPCGHRAGRKCILTWLQQNKKDSCPICRMRFFLAVPWPQLVPDERYWDELKHFIPDFYKICMTLYRSDYTLENIGANPRVQSPPGWIVRATGRYGQDSESLRGFLRDHESRRTFAREILSTSPPEVEKAAWMLQTYPKPGELEAHVEALASALEAADPKGVTHIQLRDSGGATIHQVDNYTDPDKPYQDEGFFRHLVIRGALDGAPLTRASRQGSWWVYWGDGIDFSTHASEFWQELGEPDPYIDFEPELPLEQGIRDPDGDGGDTAEADAAFGKGLHNGEDRYYFDPLNDSK